MPSNLFVTGFPYELTQDELAKIFSACGTVSHVKILTDRDNGRSRGIGFVKMSTDAEGDAAIAKFNNTPIGARTLFVEGAKPPPTPAPRDGGRPTDASGGFVERRSGKDRRRQPVGPWDPSDRRNNSGAAAPAPSAERKWEPRPAAFGEKRPFGDKKPWEKKPFGEKKSFGDKKPWEKKPFGEKKAFGDKKPWERKPFDEKKSFGAKKPFGDKPWERKPSDEKKSFGDRKPWEKKSFHDIPSTAGGKKPFGERKPWEKKPFDDKKPGGGFGPKKRFFKPGGFGGKGRGSSSHGK